MQWKSKLISNYIPIATIQGLGKKEVPELPQLNESL